MSDQPTARTPDDDTPALRASTPQHGPTDEGENQDVAAEKIYPTDPTGQDPA
ncbi:hypothetical protein [uncultured Cellulomonas sp.]|uniref:hypothetical protein n=1 Tax=uncultured Cellulomonas sp. TaxID=189682 RepID=UPI0028E4D76C|nr:hypothetical protein [uncultured Cellulomonas sp.]